MAHSRFAEPRRERPLDARQTHVLLDIAEGAIVDGLRRVRPTPPLPSTLAADLRRPTGTFVTLNVRGKLNGCIGSLQTAEPMGVSVARHAWSAAFADPRMPALRWVDYRHLDIEISILSELSPRPAASFAELIGVLRVGTDGLLISSGARRAVFLPSVWAQLRSPEMFLTHLFHKAGLDPAHWPADLRAEVFTAEKIARRAEPCIEADRARDDR
jgi:AmmeMemoRadiSam system protein A